MSDLCFALEQRQFQSEPFLGPLMKGRLYELTLSKFGFSLSPSPPLSLVLTYANKHPYTHKDVQLVTPWPKYFTRLQKDTHSHFHIIIFQTELTLSLSFSSLSVLVFFSFVLGDGGKQGWPTPTWMQNPPHGYKSRGWSKLVE